VGLTVTNSEHASKENLEEGLEIGPTCPAWAMRAEWLVRKQAVAKETALCLPHVSGQLCLCPFYGMCCPTPRECGSSHCPFRDSVRAWGAGGARQHMQISADFGGLPANDIYELMLCNHLISSLNHTGLMED
jgi:hypothetical protein